MNEKVVIVGAGSAMFTRGLVRDLIARKWEGEVRLVDIDSSALDTALRLSRKMVDLAGSALEVRASEERRDLLPGATLIVATVGVGGRRAWERDVFIPREYGIFQPVGDTVAPGGTSRAMRMIPAMVDIAEDVKRLAPDALFFNYGNPMSPVCRAIRKRGIAVIGLCHGVIEVARYLARTLSVPLSELTYDAAGINHLTWFTNIRVGGTDVESRLREIAREKTAGLDAPVSGASVGTEATKQVAKPGGKPGTEATKPDSPASWQLFERFGAFPAVLDRHACEFFPAIFCRRGAYYGKTLGIDAFSFEATIAHGDSIFAEMQRDAEASGRLPESYFERIGGEHEQIVEIVEKIRSGVSAEFSANLPNRGQVMNIAAESVVESPCLTTSTGLVPARTVELPHALAGTLATRFAWVECVVDAALAGSHRGFVQSLILDGAVDSIRTADRLADDLLAAQQEYLPK